MTTKKRIPKGRRVVFKVDRTKHPFIWRVSLAWMQILDSGEAMTALPLLLAIAHEMRMAGKATIPLTSTTWEWAQAHSKRRKETLLRSLKLVPSLVSLERRSSVPPLYFVSQGPLWASPYFYGDNAKEQREAYRMAAAAKALAKVRRSLDSLSSGKDEDERGRPV
jgi:hypothetical protein